MLNTVTIEGRLTRDPEIRTTPSGTILANISLANERGFGEKKRTNFFEVTIWGDAADRLTKAKAAKGSHIYVNGVLDHQTFEDKEGKKRSTVKIVVGNIGEWGYISSGKKPEDGATTANGNGATASNLPLPDDFGEFVAGDDLPF